MLNDPTGDPNNYRPYREYGSNLPVAQHTHYQNYNALQVLLSRASSKFSYTPPTRGRRRWASEAAARGRRPSRPSTSAIGPTASSLTTGRTF